MMELPINNISDLRNEILRLESLETIQHSALKERFSSPGAVIASLMTIFPKSATADGIKHSGLFGQDFLGLVSRFVLPLTLNKTLFKNSNFLVKALVGVLSQKASHYISEDAVGGVWHKVKSLFKKKPKTEPVVVTTDYNFKTGTDAAGTAAATI